MILLRVGLLLLFLVFNHICIAEELAPVQGAEGKQFTIRSITITVREIFEDENAGRFYSTANAAKFATNEAVLKRELLIKEGAKYDPFLVEESERALRNLRFVNNVEIIPTFEGDYVDLNVMVQDTWTLIPILNYASGGGNTRQTIGVSDSNIMGTGKHLEFLYDKNGNREEIEGLWIDPQLFGTRKNLLLGYSDRNDGYIFTGAVGRPFRGLVDKESWQVSTINGDTIGRLYANGDERFIYRQDFIDFSGIYTVTRGNPEVVALRYSAGYDFADHSFFQADADDYDDADVDPNSLVQDPSLLADDRRFSGPFLGFERVEADFIKRNYVDRFQLIEDFNLGNDFETKIGISPSTFGGIDDNLLLSLNDSDGMMLSGNSFLRGEFGVASRLSNDGLENSLIRAEVKYYNLLGPKYIGDTYIGNHTIATSLSFNYGDDLDRDREFLLGAESGLRGYSDRTFFGDKMVLFNAEERFHLFDDVLQLVSVGGAFFGDIGGTTQGTLGDLFGDEIYSDIGVGLRFGFPRSSGSRVLRVDLAFPLRDGPDGSDRFELRIILEGGNVTRARLPSEEQGLEAANSVLGKQ